MRQRVRWQSGAFIAGLCVVIATVWTSTTATTQSSGDRTTDAAFLRANRCYRFTFPIAGAPNWKVLDVLDAGWIKAEIDAGPRSAVREPVWVNTAQIISVRAAQCSE